MLRAKWEALCDELGLFPDLERRVQVYQAFQSGARDHHLLEVYREARDNQAVREALKVWFHDRFAQASLKSGVPSSILSDATLANTATRFNAEEGVPAREAMLHEYAAHFSLMDDEAPLAFLPPVDGTAVRKVYLGLSSRLLSLDRTARLGHVLDMLDRLDDEALHRKLMFALTARFAIRGFKGSRAAGRRWAEREKFVAGRLAAVDAQFPPIVDLLAEMAQRSAFSRDGLMDGIGEEGADIPSLRRRLAEIGLGRLAEGLFMDTRIALQEPNFEDLPEGAVKSVEDLGYDPREILSPSLTVSSELHLDDGIDTDFFIGGLRFIEVASYSRLEDNFGYDRAIDQDSALSLADAVDEDGLERFLNLESEMDLADNGPGVAIEDMTWTLGFRDESPLTDAIGPDVNIMASDASDLSDAFGIDASAGHSSALGMSDDFTLSAFFDESSVLGPTDETDLLSRPVRDVSSSLTLRDSLAEDPQASLSELASMADLADSLSLEDSAAPASEIRTEDAGSLTDAAALNAGMDAVDALDLRDMTSAARDSDILSALALSDAHAADGAFSVTDDLDLSDAVGRDASIRAESGLPLSDGMDGFTGEADLSDGLSMEDALAFVSEIEADASSALSDAFSRDVSMDAESGLGLGDLASAARLFELTSSMTPSDAHSLEGDISFEDAVSLTATIENEEITQEESGLDLADEASGFVGVMDLSDGLSMADMAGMDAEVTAMSDISLSDNAQDGAGIAATDELGLADDHDVLPALAFSDGLGLLDAIDGFVADKDAESALGMLDAIIIGEGITAESRTDLADAFEFESILDVASHADLRDMAALHSEMDASSGIDMDDAHLLGDGLTMASEASLADEFAMAGDFDAASGLSPSDAMDPPGPILEMDDEGVLADGFVLGEATASHASALDLRDLHAIFEGVVEESALGLGDAADLAGAFPSESELDLGDDGLPHAATAAFEDEEVLADDHAGAGESGSMDALAPSDAVTLDLGLTFSDALSLTDAVDLDSVIRITVDWDIPDTSDPESFIHPSEHDLDGDVFFRTGGSVMVFRYRENDDSEVRAWGNVAFIESNNWLLNGVALTFPTPFNNNAARVTDPISNADRDRILGLADASSALDLGDAFALGQPLHEFVSGLNLEDVFSIAQEKEFSDDLSISDAIDVLPGLDASSAITPSDASSLAGVLDLDDGLSVGDGMDMAGEAQASDASDLSDHADLEAAMDLADTASLSDGLAAEGGFGVSDAVSLSDAAGLDFSIQASDALSLSDAAGVDSSLSHTVDWDIGNPSSPPSFIHPDETDLDSSVVHREPVPGVRSSVIILRYRSNNDSEVRMWGDVDYIESNEWRINGVSLTFPNSFNNGLARVTDANISNALRDRILGLADASSALGLSDAFALGQPLHEFTAALSLADVFSIAQEKEFSDGLSISDAVDVLPGLDTLESLSLSDSAEAFRGTLGLADAEELDDALEMLGSIQGTETLDLGDGMALASETEAEDAASLTDAIQEDGSFGETSEETMEDDAQLEAGLTFTDALDLSDAADFDSTVRITVDWRISDPSDPDTFIHPDSHDLDGDVFHRTGGPVLVFRYRTNDDSEIRAWGDLDTISGTSWILNGLSVSFPNPFGGGTARVTDANISNADRDRILGLADADSALSLGDGSAVDAAGSTHVEDGGLSDAMSLGAASFPRESALSLGDQVELFIVRRGTVAWDIDLDNIQSWVPPADTDLPTDIFYRAGGARILSFGYRQNNASVMVAWGDLDEIGNGVWEINGVQIRFETATSNGTALRTGYSISDADRDRILGLATHESALSLTEASSAGDAEFRSSDAMAMADAAALDVGLAASDALALSDRAVLAQTIDATVDWDIDDPSDPPSFINHAATDLDTSIFYRTGGNFVVLRYRTSNDSDVRFWGDLDAIRAATITLNGVTLTIARDVSGGVGTLENISNAVRDRILGIMAQTDALDLADDAELEAEGLSATSSLSPSDALDAPVLETGFTDALDLTDSVTLEVAGTALSGTVDWDIDDPSDPGTFIAPAEHDLDTDIFYRTSGDFLVFRYRSNNDSEVRAWGDVDAIEASPVTINGIELTFATPFNNNNARVTGPISNAVRDRILGLMDQTSILDLADNADLVTDLVRTGTVAWDVRLPNIQAFVPPLSMDLPTEIFFRAGGLRVLSFDYNTNGNSAVIAWGDVDEIENGIWEINGVQLRFTASASNNTARRTDYNISNADRDRILGLMDQSSPLDLADDAALDVGGLSATSSLSMTDALDAPVLEMGFTDALDLTDAAVLDSSTTIYGTVDWNIADPSNPGTFVHPSEHDLDAAVFYRTNGSIIILRYRSNNDSEVRAWGDVDLIEASDISINGVSLSFPNPFNNNNARVTDADISNADRDRILGLMDQTDALDLTDNAALEATVPVGADDLTWDGDPIQWDGENVSWIGGSAMDVEIEATDALSLSDAASGFSGEMDADSALDLGDESVIGRPLLRWLQEETNYDAAISEVNADEHGDDLIVDANDADAVPNPVVLDGDATDEIDADVILHGGVYIGRTSTLTPSDAVTLEVGTAEPPAEELSNFDRIAAMEGSFAVRITAEDDATDYWEVSDNEGTLLESHPDDMFDNTAVFWIERFGYQSRGRIRMHRGDSTVSFRNEIATSAYTLVIIDETDEEYMMIEARSYTTAGDGYALYDVDGFSVEASDTGGQSRADWLGSRHEHELVLAFITDSSWRPSF